MHPPDTRARNSLHLLLVGRDGGCLDPTGLLVALGGHTATVVVWSPDDDGPDDETVQRAADLLDAVERLTGTRPGYVEAGGEIAAVVRSLAGDDVAPSSTSIIALSARAPRGLVRTLRRSAAATGAHLALVPPRPVPSERSDLT